jgi:hypothetical protein
MESDTPNQAERIVAQWTKIAAYCRAAAATLPADQEPDSPHIYPGDEWKEEMMRGAIEDDCGGQAFFALGHWRETGQWDYDSPESGHFIADRLEWAAKFSELLATAPSPECGLTAGPGFHSGTPVRDVVYWLAWDIYGHYHPKRLQRWGDRRVGEY